jgi:hypothetical protein
MGVAVGLLVGSACSDSAGPDPKPSPLLGGLLTGDLAVGTATSGSSLDPDGYTVTLDLLQSNSVATNGSATFSGVLAGPHVVAISGVAGNCMVSGGTTRTPVVPLGGTAQVSFAITCAATGPTTGDLTVATATTGSNLDPDGYTVTLDGNTNRAIGTNASTTFSGLPAGSHTVVLSGVAGNCSVSGGTSRTVNVTAGGTASASFAVSCAATTPTTGDLTVATATTGSNLDPDGYTVTLDGNTNRAIGTNASTTFSGLPAGSHTVVLSGVAGNCSVSGGTSRTVNVPAGGTASASFAVSCAAATGDGSLTVTASTTGSNLDPDGYTVTVDGGTASQPIATNGSVTFTGPAGDHTIALSGVAANCSVSGANPRTVSVPAGGTTSTTFAVSCTATTPTTGDLTVATATTGSNLDPDGYTVTLDGNTNRAIGTNASTTFSGLPAGSHTVVLSGVAGNCSVSGGTSRTVSVPAGGTASASFAVSCTATTPPAGRVIGRGQVGTASPTPGNDAVTFDFDVRADLTGRFTGTDYADLHPGGVPATLTTDQASDPETRITAYRNSSSVCSDPSRGVEVDAIGREDTGGLVAYTLSVCDNGPAGSGTDFFSVFIPSEGFSRSGTVASGDIAKS